MIDFQWYLYLFNCNCMAFIIIMGTKQDVDIDHAKPATKKNKEKRIQTKCH